MRIGIRNERHTDLREIKKELSGTLVNIPRLKQRGCFRSHWDGGILAGVNHKAF
jgi:hypothetical protein